MDQHSQDDGPHHRRSKRSLVLLAAKIRTQSGHLDARLRNLSQNGALLEAEAPPAVDSEIVFERGETAVRGRVAWISGNRFGIEFFDPIEESEVLIHVGRPKPSAPDPKPLYRRTGFRDRPMTEAERNAGAAWVRPLGRAD